MTKYILSLDGGGVRGVFSASVLDNIRNSTGKPLHTIFDLVVGTSIGGLLACTVAAGKYDGKLLELFSAKHMRTILDKSWWDEILAIQTCPKYDGKGKRNILKNVFGKQRFGDLLVPTLITTFNLHTQEPVVFYSKDPEHRKLSIVDVLDATSAAPTYFPPVSINNDLYVDGAIMANNPALVGYVKAIKLWGHGEDRCMVSIGTGRGKRVEIDRGDKVKRWGVIKWMLNGLIDMLSNTPNDYFDDVMEDLCPDHTYVRLDSSLIGISMDDTTDETLDILAETGHQVYETHRDKVLHVLRNVIGNVVEGKMCKGCNSNDVTHVFIPCGHTLFCGNCVNSPSRSVCPLCKKDVQSVVRIQLAVSPLLS